MAAPEVQVAEWLVAELNASVARQSLAMFATSKTLPVQLPVEGSRGIRIGLSDPALGSEIVVAVVAGGAEVEIAVVANALVKALVQAMGGTEKREPIWRVEATAFRGADGASTVLDELVQLAVSPRRSAGVTSWRMKHITTRYCAQCHLPGHTKPCIFAAPPAGTGATRRTTAVKRRLAGPSPQAVEFQKAMESVVALRDLHPDLFQSVEVHADLLASGTPFTVLVYGSHGVGKSTLINRLLTGYASGNWPLGAPSLPFAVEVQVDQKMDRYAVQVVYCDDAEVKFRHHVLSGAAELSASSIRAAVARALFEDFESQRTETSHAITAECGAGDTCAMGSLCADLDADEDCSSALQWISMRLSRLHHHLEHVYWRPFIDRVRISGPFPHSAQAQLPDLRPISFIDVPWYNVADPAAAELLEHQVKALLDQVQAVAVLNAGGRGISSALQSAIRAGIDDGELREQLTLQRPLLAANATRTVPLVILDTLGIDGEVVLVPQAERHLLRVSDLQRKIQESVSQKLHDVALHQRLLDSLESRSQDGGGMDAGSGTRAMHNLARSSTVWARLSTFLAPTQDAWLEATHDALQLAVLRIQAMAYFCAVQPALATAPQRIAENAANAGGHARRLDPPRSWKNRVRETIGLLETSLLTELQPVLGARRSAESRSIAIRMVAIADAVDRIRDLLIDQALAQVEKWELSASHPPPAMPVEDSIRDQWNRLKKWLQDASACGDRLQQSGADVELVSKALAKVLLAFLEPRRRDVAAEATLNSAFASIQDDELRQLHSRAVGSSSLSQELSFVMDSSPVRTKRHQKSMVQEVKAVMQKRSKWDNIWNPMPMPQETVPIMHGLTRAAMMRACDGQPQGVSHPPSDAWYALHKPERTVCRTARVARKGPAHPVHPQFCFACSCEQQPGVHFHEERIGAEWAALDSDSKHEGAGPKQLVFVLNSVAVGDEWYEPNWAQHKSYLKTRASICAAEGLQAIAVVLPRHVDLVKHAQSTSGSQFPVFVLPSDTCNVPTALRAIVAVSQALGRHHVVVMPDNVESLMFLDAWDMRLSQEASKTSSFARGLLTSVQDLAAASQRSVEVGMKLLNESEYFQGRQHVLLQLGPALDEVEASRFEDIAQRALQLKNKPIDKVVKALVAEHKITAEDSVAFRSVLGPLLRQSLAAHELSHQLQDALRSSWSFGKLKDQTTQLQAAWAQLGADFESRTLTLSTLHEFQRKAQAVLPLLEPLVASELPAIRALSAMLADDAYFSRAVSMGLAPMLLLSKSGGTEALTWQANVQWITDVSTENPFIVCCDVDAMVKLLDSWVPKPTVASAVSLNWTHVQAGKKLVAVNSTLWQFYRDIALAWQQLVQHAASLGLRSVSSRYFQFRLVTNWWQPADNRVATHRLTSRFSSLIQFEKAILLAGKLDPSGVQVIDLDASDSEDE